MKHTQQVMKGRNKRVMVHNSYCPLVLTKVLSPASAAALLFYFPFVPSLHSSSLSSLPLILSDTTVLLFISATFSRRSFRHARAPRRTFWRHKTMSAGRLFLAARSSQRCIILAVLKENLRSHTSSVTLSLALLSPAEN